MRHPIFHYGWGSHVWFMEKQLGIRLSDYKMKVLYANLLFGDHIFGHKNLDTNILKALKYNIQKIKFMEKTDLLII